MPGQRHGRARDGITMLCDIMGHGTESLVTRALRLFGEDAFRIALHHAVASAAWFEDRESSGTGTLTAEMKQQLEAAAAGYPGPSTSLSPQATRLSAPGFEPAGLQGKPGPDKKSRNRKTGS